MAFSARTQRLSDHGPLGGVHHIELKNNDSPLAAARWLRGSSTAVIISDAAVLLPPVKKSAAPVACPAAATMSWDAGTPSKQQRPADLPSASPVDDHPSSPPRRSWKASCGGLHVSPPKQPSFTSSSSSSSSEEELLETGTYTNNPAHILIIRDTFDRLRVVTGSSGNTEGVFLSSFTSSSSSSSSDSEEELLPREETNPHHNTIAWDGEVEVEQLLHMDPEADLTGDLAVVGIEQAAVAAVVVNVGTDSWSETPEEEEADDDPLSLETDLSDDDLSLENDLSLETDSEDDSVCAGKERSVHQNS